MRSTWFHTAAMDLWRPYLKADDADGQQVEITAYRYARSAYSSSLRQLQRLIYTYRKNCEETHPTMLITPGLVSLLNEVFRDSSSPNAQLYFFLSMHGLLEMAPWCHGLCGIMKAFLGLGVRSGVFQRPGWDGSVVEGIERAAAELGQGVVYSSAYPIDLTLEANDMESGSMEVLATEFQHSLSHDDASNNSEANPGDDGAAAGDTPMWRGDPRDLNLTLCKATEGDIGMY